MTVASLWSSLLDPLRGVLRTGIDLVHDHVQLFGVELEQQLWRARSLLMQAVTALLLTFLAAGFAGFALIAFFWDSHRQLVVTLVATFFAALAMVATIVLKRSVDARLRPFTSTLQALERDRDALRGGR